MGHSSALRELTSKNFLSFFCFIVNQFKKSGEISEDRKPLVDVHDLWTVAKVALHEKPSCHHGRCRHKSFQSAQSTTASRGVTHHRVIKGGSYFSTLHTISSSQMDRKTMNTCSVFRWVHVSAAFRKYRCWVLRAKDGKKHPQKVQKPMSVPVRWCISVRSIGNLHMC